jgi:uncharacterized membrane protein
MDLLFRWTHVVAGVLWIGHLYFFNFVNAQVAKTYDAEAKKKVVPELMPRALYWFRWGAAYTWITGILLLGILYYMNGYLLEAGATTSKGVATAIGLGVLVAGFIAYDLLMGTPLKGNPVAVAVLGVVLTSGVGFFLGRILSPRAVYIHIGAMFGTIMAANVWMRIWPAQRKIIAALKAGQAPDAALVATAGTRSKNNTYLSVPLLLFMVSNHYPVVLLGGQPIALYVGAITAVGFGITWLLYNKSASEGPKSF